MYVLGISAFYHDSAAALLDGGDIIAAAQEERFTRRKHDSNFPEKAIEYCLAEAGITLRQVEHIVFYDKPFLKFERLLENYLAFAPKGFPSFLKAIPVWLKEKLFQKKLLTDELQKFAPGVDIEARLRFAEHHHSHAASAFYPSPFKEAAILTMDGVGEWATTSLAIGKGEHIEITKEIHFPHSLGLLYSAFTCYTGFRVNSGEYKLMGLAPYGEPKYAGLIRDNLIDVKDDGSFRLNMDYFDYCTGLRMTNARFDALFGGPPRRAESEIGQREMDIAASIQQVLEEVVLKLARSIAKETGQKNLCLAGGVALNCVANGKVLRDGAFENIWIQPAAGDAGGALGAALLASHGLLEIPRKVQPGADAMKGSYLGPQFSQGDIEARLGKAGAVFKVLDDQTLNETAAEALAAGSGVGWFQGRMEFGPRALGNRSILGDPRSPEMQKTLNLKVKYRESFRPFAPSIRAEDIAEWFELDTPSPYMLIVAGVHEKRRIAVDESDAGLSGIDKLNVARSQIPAVTHVDYSARVQSVSKQENPRYHALLSAFAEKTGCPVLVNTSFNIRGEPIVATPEDAFRCFMGTQIELLVVGNCLMHKNEQNPELARNYRDSFALD